MLLFSASNTTCCHPVQRMKSPSVQPFTVRVSEGVETHCISSFLTTCVCFLICVYICVSVCMCQCVCLSTCNKGQSRSVRVLDFWWSLTLLELLIDDIQNMNHYQTFVYIILSHNIYSGTLFSLIVPPDICRFDKYESSMCVERVL